MTSSMDVACVAGGISALNAVWSRPARRIGGGAERRMRTSPIEIPSALILGYFEYTYIYIYIHLFNKAG